MKKTNKTQSTQNSDYTNRLVRKQTVWWKKILNVQAPYRWNLRRLKPGRTLEIGCGIGRNLMHLNGQGVGIDHNAPSIQVAKRLGLTAFTSEEFEQTQFNSPGIFETLLLAHVAEHMTQPEAVDLVRKYLPMLRHDGRLIIIAPQEAGYKSDSTHVEFMDYQKLREIHAELGLDFQLEYSFPFPRFAGSIFTYNEFISISKKS